MRTILFHLVCALVFVGFGGVAAFACSCVQVTGIPLQKQVEESKLMARAVFSGKVLSVVGNMESWNLIVRFEVADLWKGNIGRNIEITTPTSSASCGYSFEEGKSYLVYAYGEVTDAPKAKLMTGLCTRTRRLSKAKEDIQFLGSPLEPAKK